MNKKIRLLFLAFTVLSIGAATLVGAEAVELKRSGTHIDVLIGGKPFTTYYFGPESPKPYLHPLRSAHGTIVTRGFPMRKDIPGESRDHPHHRAMYFAHGNINGIDFWGEAQFEEKAPVSIKGKKYIAENLPYGRTVFRKLEELRGGPDTGSIRALFDLDDPDGKAIA